MKRKPTRFTVDISEDSDAQVYQSDPIDEEGSSDCECIFAFVASRIEGEEPAARCVHCGRLAT